MKPDLSIVIPAYNEEKRLGPNLGPVLKYFKTQFPNYELIIVDDGSTDQTADTVKVAISKEPRAKLISYSTNRGKGYAVRTGVLASKGKRVLFMDADMSTPLDQVPKILKSLETADVVIGSRGQVNSDIRQRPPVYRRIASWVFDQIKFAMVGLREFKDTQCGFKAFKGDTARKLFSKSKIDRFMFDAEILYLAQKSGMTIREIPVAWADMPDSKVKFLEGVIYMFLDLWRIRYTK
jgi:dolichyl-phosphate beta-glucosyltransferase